MFFYSSLLALTLAVSAPWWLWRMASSGRYRAGLAGRLGSLPRQLDDVIAGRAAAEGLIWIHAVSVGEVLAGERLVAELRAALPGFLVVVSTTTAAGFKVAGEKLGIPVFYFPLDFAFAVRSYLQALRPSLFVTMESEFWPRILVECERAQVPVAVVNARVSDRSFPRYMRLRRLWRPLLAKVRLFLAQGEESAERLRQIGVAGDRVRVVGNLKYDAPLVAKNRVAEIIKQAAQGRPIVVAGSTADRKNDKSLSEDEMVIQAWEGELRTVHHAMLVLAPRHPQRFGEVQAVAMQFGLQNASKMVQGQESTPNGTEIVLLDTIGDLAAVYKVADVAFVGGSLVAKGGQNPLEAARFGVPVVMGPSYENFREMVDAMRGTDAIGIVQKREQLESALIDALKHGSSMGGRARLFFESQAGATQRTVEALMELVR
jgi:3-deoxy-D-manno-octulosonic-acid transferase